MSERSISRHNVPTHKYRRRRGTGSKKTTRSPVERRGLCELFDFLRSVICASVNASGASQDASKNRNDACEKSRKGLLCFTKLNLKRGEVVLEEDAWVDIPASTRKLRQSKHIQRSICGNIIESEQNQIRIFEPNEGKKLKNVHSAHEVGVLPHFVDRVLKRLQRIARRLAEGTEDSWHDIDCVLEMRKLLVNNMSHVIKRKHHAIEFSPK